MIIMLFSTCLLPLLVDFSTPIWLPIKLSAHDLLPAPLSCIAWCVFHIVMLAAKPAGGTGMLRSYYVALPLTLLPSSVWQTLDALTRQGAAGWDPSVAHLGQALKHLPGSVTALQGLVSSCMTTLRMHVKMQAFSRGVQVICHCL